MENPKLLYTGASGFIGTNIKPLLSKIYHVKTLGLTKYDDYKINLSKEIPFFDEKFDIVLHTVGKAHSIPKTVEEKKAFFDVNLQGTKNLCASLEKERIPKSLIFISTVAVYGLDYGEEISENCSLNGTTPYALSKLLAEQFLQDWCKKNSVVLGILRPSLIAGPNPPGNLGSMINGIKTGKYLSIAGGKARKSVLMVDDIARLVPKLTDKGGIFNICDDSQPTFRELEMLISHQLGKKIPLSIPLKYAKLLAKVGDIIGNNATINTIKLKKITESLTFSNEKAKSELNWQPLNVLENFKIE